MAVNNEYFETLKSVLEQVSGRELPEITDLQGIIDAGNDPTILQEKEQFYKALVNKIVETKFIGNNTQYRGKLEDLFYTDEQEFGAITEIADVVPPEVVSNPSWLAVVDGVTKLHDTPVALAKVYANVYGGSVAAALNITFSDIQSKSAFRDAKGMMKFFDYIKLQVSNALTKHKEALTRLSLLNFIGEKYAYAQSEDAEGVHVVDLVKDYAEFAGLDSMSVNEYLQSPKALLRGIQMFNFYADAMQEWDCQFNTAGRDRFTPSDRLVFIVNSLFNSTLKTVALSDSSWDKAFMEGRNRVEVASWQGTKGLDFDVMTHITVKTATGETVEIGNCVGVMLDKWAIMRTKVDDYVGADRDDIKRLTTYSYQFTDRSLNNLTLNGLVFVLNDYTKPSNL